MSSAPRSSLGRRIYKGLFTHEDKYNIHKLFGLFCLLHFLYRFGNVGESDMRFNASWATAASLVPHFGLSTSSLIFRIPTKRIVEGSRIWPEYRLHSIVFACRSLACMLLTWIEAAYGLAPNYHVNTAIVLGSIAAADLGSWSVGEQARSSTIRDLSAPPALRYFFSVMQFHASAGCLLGVRRFSTQFIYVWIVQFTAFLMTLRRKNLVPHTPLLYIYGVMLSFGFFVATSDALLHSSWALVNALANGAAYLRLGWRVNKYALWLGMAAVAHVGRKSVAGEEGYGEYASLWPLLWLASVAGVLSVGHRYVTKANAAEAKEAKEAKEAGKAD